MKAKSFLPNYCKVIDCHSERQQVCQWVFVTFVVGFFFWGGGGGGVGGERLVCAAG